MWRRPVVTILMLIIAVILPLAPRAQQKNVGPSGAGPRPNAVRPYVASAAQTGGATTAAPAKPFTQEQVVSMVRAGLGDESGAKLIEQRGIDFAPSEDFCQTLKAAGASEAFLAALRAAKRPEPATAKKPINQVQVITLLAVQVPSHRVTMLVQERGIDFEPTDDYLQEVRLAGGEESALQIRASEDTWQWGLETEAVYNEIVTGTPLSKHAPRGENPALGGGNGIGH
ncbi:MAG TPA: hypothetical protein VKO18_16885 [Terriglobia bacterium]|nr:hypothetical protein [Terriglobia bacterium]